ncbi:hypothetical protein [Corynebacterium kozikiae]|uniref:hypothetical protein n=1 Tax=Corynebacterium kozikiae TaxID=2968469 RepID=UPI00211C5050|nr:hypothetical protein [Corynebacterium sp. 76QC2CO]MCQ9343738.1 hypothetical protein [Corynebacterium sp. 76QC2CO]
MRLTQRLAAAALVAAFASASPAVTQSSAAPLVGMTGVNTQGEGTNNLKITLTKGTAADGTPSEGSVVGVTIVAKRLAGIIPTDPQSMDKVNNADFAEVLTWPTDHTIEVATDTQGSVSLKDLPNGVYVVTSIPAPGVREVNPFLVAVPFHTGEQGEQLEGVILAKPRDFNPPPPSITPPPPATTTTPPPASTPEPPVPNEPPTQSRVPGLAMTGAQVIAIVAAAAAMILLGGYLLIAGRRRN